MRKLILMAVAAVMATSAFAQGTVKKVRIYKGEKIAYEEKYDDVDSIVFVDVPVLPEGALSGKFSVSDSKKVHFSKGNLQAGFDGTKWNWFFAPNQWDYVGNATANTSITGDGIVSVNDTVDLFGWSTAATKYGINKSTENSTYSGNFEEWGNNIVEGWYTLSTDEWGYLFHGRDKADELFGLGSVNGINGTIILPDDWTLPTGAIFNNAKDNNLVWQSEDYYHNSNSNNFSHNTYTAEQWDTMEKAGAVFLPAAGKRSGTIMNDVGSFGYYWSSTPRTVYRTYYVIFGSSNLFPQSDSGRSSGHSVRLVREVK